MWSAGRCRCRCLLPSTRCGWHSSVCAMIVSGFFSFISLISRQTNAQSASACLDGVSRVESSQSRLGSIRLTRLDSSLMQHTTVVATRPSGTVAPQPCWGVPTGTRYEQTNSIRQYPALLVFQVAVVPSTLDCSVCSNTPTDLYRSCKETLQDIIPCLTPAPLGTDRTQQQQQHNRVWLEGSAGIRFHSVHCNWCIVRSARRPLFTLVLRVSDPSPQFITYDRATVKNDGHKNNNNKWRCRRTGSSLLPSSWRS